jgi:hypothetical protein
MLQLQKRLLHIFNEASGLHCNMAKSSLSLIFEDDDTIAEISNLPGCRTVNLPTIYLGLPLYFIRP